MALIHNQQLYVFLLFKNNIFQKKIYHKSFSILRTFFASFLRFGGTSRKMKNSVYKHVFMRPGLKLVRV